MKMTDLDEGIMKNISRGIRGWGTGLADNKPKDVVKRNKGYDDETTKMLHKTAGGPEHSPASLQKRVLDREMKKRGLDVDEGRYGSSDAYQRDYDSSRTGFSRGRRDDDEYHVPDPSPAHDHARKETSLYNVKVGGQAVNPKPILGRSNAIAWAKHAIAQGQFTADEATLSPVHGVSETATAGSTSAGNVGVGAVYPNKPPKQPKNKNGTAKNALDINANLITGGSIKR